MEADPPQCRAAPPPALVPGFCSCCILFTEELKHWFPLGMERRRSWGRRSQELLPHYQRGTGSPRRPCDSSSTHVSCVMEMIRLWSVTWVIVGRGNGSFAHLSHTQRVVCVPACAQVHRYVGAEGTLRCCSSGSSILCFETLARKSPKRAGRLVSEPQAVGSSTPSRPAFTQALSLGSQAAR